MFALCLQVASSPQGFALTDKLQISERRVSLGDLERSHQVQGGVIKTLGADDRTYNTVVMTRQ